MIDICSNSSNSFSQHVSPLPNPQVEEQILIRFSFYSIFLQENKE